MMPSSTNLLLSVLFLLLFIGRPAECTFQLDQFMSYKFAKLFLDRTLTLQLDIKQKNQTEFDLFKINHRGEAIFHLLASTIQNIILIEFRMKDGQWKKIKISCPFLLADDQFHKIIFILDDRKMAVAENCRQLFSTEESQLEFGNLSANELTTIVGPNGRSDNADLQIREFSVDSAIPLESRCPHLEMLIDNRVEKEYYLPSNGIGKQPEEEGGREGTKQREDVGEQGMLQRIALLERQLAHWNKRFALFENKIKRVELHQRGCVGSDGTKMMSPGQRVQNLSDCTECQCGLDSTLHCKPIGCPRLDCAHPVHVPGKCCPQCGRKCLHNGKYYESGELFWPKQCTFCLCDDGRMQCGFKFPNNCPALDCPQQETLPNQCCPVCLNVDHCAPERNPPCSDNATCHSGKYSAICRCKEGFFGNGTICTDVDECLWDEEARKQLGGCGEGTICINLAGSFKCECLPGYQKLDNRNCLDVIRI